ncbi:fungal-specific transcription factor [Colletotrichum zoysiae]|uniref:Fungal-specific transcription factor n=1 Tax=Colletotrichum zoysiae TaxID=1216348 RepID=A0AAD9HFM4_9PEZI|nr:fungal-specific transcription factor [Colletotrichum zoysiae]
MASRDHPRQQQQQQQQQRTFALASAPENGRLPPPSPPPPTSHPHNGTSHLPVTAAPGAAAAAAAAFIADPEPSPSSSSATPGRPSNNGSKRADSVDGATASTSPDPANPDAPSRKKQRRNKPTLSCSECVERKTKCDRGRPHCLACIKRQTECKYAVVANILDETSRSITNGRRMTKPPKKKPSDVSSIPNIADRGLTEGRGFTSRGSVGSIAFSSSTGLLSNVPYSLPTASNVFGIGSEHPFANYWTCEGGLPEVISVLPDKIQADILLAQYFECVDPVYPMIHRQTFYADYEHFWSLAPDEKNRVDAAFVGLIFVMLALGTQFVTSTSPRDGKQTAEFYASASNQALRMFSYLSAASLRSIQAMVLLTYFLINDNHASDGWAFAGILIRQAYAMGLHRDPNIVTPEASIFEKQQRRKLWQAVLLQDTFLTVLLSLPPSATHTDVSVEDLMDDGSAIASSDPTDIAYIRGSWTLANLVQETICSARSLDLPICSTPRHKSKLLSDFRAVYRSFPDVFRSWDAESLTALARANKRVVRQTLFLTSNYHHNIMLVHASESPDTPVNLRGTLEAAHEAITSFFLLFAIFELEARVWWVFNHRAFLEALCIGSVLREAARDPSTADAAERDPLFVRGRGDIGLSDSLSPSRMIQIMELMGEGEQGSDVARARVQVLKDLL